MKNPKYRITTKEQLNSVYNKKKFLTDFTRMQKELSVNGQSLKDLNINVNAPDAVDLIFIKLFEPYPNINKKKREQIEKFLMLFLHQEFLHTHMNMLVENVRNNTAEQWTISSSQRKIDIRLSENELLIQVSFLFCILVISDTEKSGNIIIREVDQEKDFFVKGKSTYKINTTSHKNGCGWIAEYGLVDSSIECKDEFKGLLDTRNLLEKLIDFITSIIEKITADLKSNPSLKSKPIFFVSENGKILDNELINPSKKLLKEITR
ncbi:hypothetical protein [Rickettsiella massiliensis]|uniref:hypothetical protein n=1 Tax=Rickettsiella massiliensis TaxID=676517 RepID=UPI00029B4DD8|nr:hypothetical protein [Rickettsiella massiliensis]